MVMLFSLVILIVVAYLVVWHLTKPLAGAAILIVVPAAYLALASHGHNPGRDYIGEGFFLVLVPFFAGFVCLAKGFVAAVFQDDARRSRLIFAGILAVPYVVPLVGLGYSFVGPGTTHYTLEVQNRTGEACSEIKVDFGSYPALLDGVANGYVSVIDQLPDPAPREATARWVTASGSHYAQTVKITSVKGKQLWGASYVFVLRQDGTIRVAPLQYKELMDGRDAKLACDDGPTYWVGVKNLTDGNLTDVAVGFGRCRVNAGDSVAAPDSRDSWVFSHSLPYPVTDSAVVRWTTADGVVHTDNVALRPLLPKALDGICICFLLDKNAPVRARAVPFEELRTGKHPELSPGWSRDGCWILRHARSSWD